MSTLEHKLLNTTETVFTAEFHTLDGNGFEKAKKYAADNKMTYGQALKAIKNQEKG